MEPILLYIESFVNKLPPLLQLLLGVFVSLGVMKIFLVIFKRLEKNDPPG
jgi:hypothetical protein